ncbi:hypothetical protein [Streptomyces scopuliridis]|uniref:hypothetical protein n=1 Tax=Streptomyces scopuliridis TaxID=452529 RepID=UPI003419093F
MSSDLRRRVAEALCENAGLTWETAWESSRTDFLTDADAVVRVLDDEREKLRDLLRSEKERADAAISREESAEKCAHEAASQAELWRKLAERQDNTAPIRTELYCAELARDEALRRVDYLKYQVESLSAHGACDVDDLKATIVSQAREIARLKGESE